MSNTARKHAEVIKAWAEGADVQWRNGISEEWREIPPGKNPYFDPVLEYRIKPEPAAMVYPTISKGEIEMLGDWSGPDWQTNFANAILRLVIDAGKVVVPFDLSQQHFVLKHMSAEGMADFLEDSPAVLGELSAVLDLRSDAKASDCNKFQDMYLRAERALVRAGFKDHGAEEWKPPVDTAATALRALGYAMDRDGSWYKPEDDVVDAEFDPDFQEVKAQKEPDELARRSCRALCEYLGKTRDDITFEQISAIVMLERLKP